MFWFRPLDDSAEGFQNWGFMTTHSWGESAAGRWTLKIQDTSSQKRDNTELGLLFLFVTSQYYETYIKVQLKYSAGLLGQASYLSSLPVSLLFHRDAKGVVPGDLWYRRAAVSQAS